MKPQLLKVSTSPVQSFSVRRDVVPHMNNQWHYHPEVELIYLKKGSGKQFIGDHISTFTAGDVILVGAHLPHYWRFDEIGDDPLKQADADVIVAHFREDFLGDQFLNLPEHKLLKNLLEIGRNGLKIIGQTKSKVIDLLECLVNAHGTHRTILLLEILATISESKNNIKLSSIGFTQDYKETEHTRINAIYDYTLEHFKRKIQLEEIAAVALISPNSFCRYFKSKTNKTYSTFLMEIRVGQACKLLMQENMNMKQLCYESGFNNLASFHKYFKITMGKSPLSYQKEFGAKKYK